MQKMFDKLEHGRGNLIPITQLEEGNSPQNELAADSPHEKQRFDI